MNDLPEKAKLILKAAVSDLDGTVMRVRYQTKPVALIANKKNLMIESNGRAIAIWDSALEELVTQGLLEKNGKDYPQNQLFKVTQAGYECAESLGF